MKKYIIIITLLISTLLLTINLNNKKTSTKKEISIVEKILSKPEGIEAYTLDNEKTTIPYENLINYYTLDKITCKNETVATFNKTDNSVSLSNIHMPDYCTMNFTDKTLYSHLMRDNSAIKTRNDFSSVYTEDNTGTLYKSTESIAGSTPMTVYYFAGNATNNWVKFGGFYWRIIRTNHDGSIRLLYAGTRPDTTEGYIGASAFNSSHADAMYVGYMYGTSGTLASNRTNENDSTIKAYIDSWYSNNLSSYTKYISTEAVYCNDRGVSDGVYASNGNSTFYYDVMYRLVNNKIPTYNCTNNKDAFSGNNSEAKLTYPIGLMTADEVAYAGGLWATNSKTWYYYNSLNDKITGIYYWDTMTPFSWTMTYSDMFMVHSETYEGHLGTGYVSSEKAVRPVISLKRNLIWKSGDGSSSSPYEIVYN